MKFDYHIYNHKTKTCEACGRSFKRKPSSSWNCPGVLIREALGDEILYMNLSRLNLSLKENAQTIAYDDCDEYEKSKSRSTDEFIYKLSDTKIIDLKLPPAYLKEDDIPKDLNAISERSMRVEGLEPKENTLPIAVIKEWFKDEAVGFYMDWQYYYREDDTRPGDSLNYITKTRLKSEYSLSDGWLKKIGEPDLLMKNPHYKKGSLMQLYKISRVREFLRDNSEEYSEWLVKRKKFVINSLRISQAQSEMKVKLQEQNELCIKCACSDYSDNGIFCAVHPMGFPPGVPLEQFCPDYED